MTPRDPPRPAAPAVDVLIPVYNAEATLEEAVASIQNQTLTDIRIFLIDDGSSDAGPAIMDRLAAEDPRVVVLRKPNSGIVDALNLGLARCEAEFVARHDADDIAFPQRLRTEVDYLTENPDCVAVSAFAKHIDADGVFMGTLARFASPARADFTWTPSKEPYLLHPFLLARRSALEAVGGYRHAHHAEDTDLYWRLRRIGRLHNLPEVLGMYRYTPSSITSRSVLNGRVSALNSQLAAVSAARRDRGAPDLTFERGARRAYEELGGASAMWEAASAGLNPDERAYLRAAFAAKMVELTAYRPYELDLEDCRFVAAALKSWRDRLDPKNARELRSALAIASARLMRKGKPGRAFTLLTPEIFGEAVLRLGLQLFARSLPMSARRKIREIRGSFIKFEAA